VAGSRNLDLNLRGTNKLPIRHQPRILVLSEEANN